MLKLRKFRQKFREINSGVLYLCNIHRNMQIAAQLPIFRQIGQIILTALEKENFVK